MITPYHAGYFAHELTRRQPEGVDRLSIRLIEEEFQRLMFDVADV